MRLHFLGTGGSWPSKRRGTTSIGVASGSTVILVDCGEGTQRQLIFSPLSPMKIKGVLITHLHGDHFLGLPGLVQTMSLNDRTEELHVWGPEGIAFSWECALRMCPFNPRFQVHIHELRGGEEFVFSGLEIRCSPVDHSIPALGYRVKEKDRPGRFNRKRALELGIPEGKLWGRIQKGERVTIKVEGEERTFGPEDVLGPPRPGPSVVFSGDTGPSPNLVELSRDADVLVHEATYGSDSSDLSAEVGHSTIKDAASTARDADVGMLVLVHSSPRYTKEERFEKYLEEAMSSFRSVFVPEDLAELEVTRRT
ncbi:MAG: ribonuclease Z [Thermoplasmatota archaeon]